MIQTFANRLFLLAIFFLPWQTAMLMGGTTITGEPSAYGVFSVYVVEAMIAFAFVLRGRRQGDARVRATWRALYWVLAAAFFSLSFSSMAVVGWFHLIHVVAAGMLYLLVTDERTDVRRVLIVFLAGLIVPVMFGWFQVLGGESPASTLFGMGAKDAATQGIAVVESGGERLLRAYGTFPHPNIFGGYIAVGILALAWLARFARTRSQLIAALLASALLGATLIVTFSRSAWLGLFLSLFVLMALMVWRRRVPPRRALPIFVLGLASVLVTLTVFYAPVLSRFDPSQRLEVISIEERAGQYATFGDVFWRAPVLGVGSGAYVFALARLDPGHPAWFYQPIHNTLLLILAELGVVGFLAFAYWVYTMDYIGHTNTHKPGGMFALSIGTCLLVIALFDHYLWSLWPGLALAAFGFAIMVQWGSVRGGD